MGIPLFLCIMSVACLSASSVIDVILYNIVLLTRGHTHGSVAHDATLRRRSTRHSDCDGYANGQLLPVPSKVSSHQSTVIGHICLIRAKHARARLDFVSQIPYVG